MRLVSLRFVYATLIGLVLAGIVHIVAVLAIPVLSEKDAVSRARTSESLDHPQPIYTVATGDDPSPPEAWLPIPDPAVAVGVCAYDLADGPMRVSARTGSLALSLAAHARRGAFYAVTDQAAVRGALDLVILTRAQYDEALADDENDPSRDVRIVAPDTRGFVVVRVIAGLPSQRPAANAAIQAVSCTTDTATDDAPTGKDSSGKGAGR
ncbi:MULTISPECIES: DUF1254 domain-containing protein [unclassified Methylobacterium]|jgi:uncharacterized membrane protein|uniref:DUF1254 domain-containing protein n=1 Tax=unclassified Methylobacterium TaxID=2615210 RepID=UPI0013550191|nr:hypothetical protein [Methylobacterium sp. 2A]MWV26042.1 hypothetical protein [Methylobacterium sp. 2A]